MHRSGSLFKAAAASTAAGAGGGGGGGTMEHDLKDLEMGGAVG